MSWTSHIDLIEETFFEDVEYLSERAKADDTVPDEFMPPKPRPDGVWFHIPDVGCATLWWPGNRSNTMRFSHCYVVPEARGEGYGKALAVYRYEYAKQHPDCERVDTLAAYSQRLFEALGFELVEYRGEANIPYLEQVF